MGCGASFVKYLLFLFNICFFLAGAAVLGVSVWLVVDDEASDYLDIVSSASGNENFEIALYGLIGIGAFVFFVGFLGCCGACTESGCMLLTYALLVGLVFALQIAAAVLAIIYKDEIDDELEKQLADQVNNDVKNDTDDVISNFWLELQYNEQCCGSINYKDYENSDWARLHPNTPVPLTCCKLANDDYKSPVPVDLDQCMKEVDDPFLVPGNATQLYTNGCYQEIKDWIDENADILIGIAFGLAAFQILCIIFACCVRSSIDEKY